MSDERGHRTVPHTADVIVEAWGPDRLICLEELVGGVVESFALVRDRSDVRRVPIGLEPGEGTSQVVALLDEVIYLVDTRGLVPIEVTLTAGPDGSLTGCLDFVPVDAVEPVGAVPKGVSWSDLVLEQRGARWWCHVLLDV
jgi:SHS2 domain-containing protein